MKNIYHFQNSCVVFSPKTISKINTKEIRNTREKIIEAIHKLFFKIIRKTRYIRVFIRLRELLYSICASNLKYLILIV